MNELERSLIDRYINNSLSGIELKEFMDRLESDESFRKSVAFQNLIVESIQTYEDQRLEEGIIKQLNYKKPLIPAGLKWILIFLSIVFLGIILWEYIGVGTYQKKGNIFRFEMFTRKSDKNEKDKSEIKKIIKQDKSDIENMTSLEREKVLTGITDSTPSKVDSESVKEVANDVNVEFKKDQLLVSHIFKVTEVSSEQKPTDLTLEQNTVTKLNPSAGLQEPAKNNDFMVEFWVSPINYKGYKMKSNKLILFGIEEPEAVKLYSYDSKLVMKYGLDYYKLHLSDEFISFTLLKPSEIPEHIK